MAVNLTGPMRHTKAVALVRGAAVSSTWRSVAGLAPTGSSIAYAVSKAALIHLTRCTAVALAPETLINCVAPGLLKARGQPQISCPRWSRSPQPARC
jgi:3-oxoacyl-[acyl-carrier protein] reductase